MGNYIKDYTQIANQKKAELFSDEAKFQRRVEAMTLVEGNLALQELIADINTCQNHRLREIARVISEYIRDELGISQTKDDVFGIIIEDVYIDKEFQGELWMNSISNKVDSFYRGENINFIFNKNVLEIIDYASKLF